MNSRGYQINNLSAFFQENGVSREDIAEKLGVSPQLVGQYINGKKPFGKKQAEKWENLFGLSRSWLLTGEGDMLISSSQFENPRSEQKKSSSLVEIPTREEESIGLKYYYEMDATAGDIQDLTDNEIGQPYRVLRIPGYEGCTAFNVRGESMLNVAKPGDIVAIESKPADIVVNGEIYLVVTKDGQRMIKRCILLPETKQLRCISDTPRSELFPPTDIDIERVHRIFRVRGFVSLSLLN